MHRILTLTLTLLILLTAGVVAQSLGTDWIVADFAANLFRVTLGGKVTSLGNFRTPSTPTIWDLTMDTDNRQVIAVLGRTGVNPGHLLRIDLKSLLAATVATGFSPFCVKVDQDGDYLVGGLGGTKPSVLKVKRDGSAINTLRPGFSWVPVFEQDRVTGDWIVAPASSSVLRYDDSWATLVTFVTHSFGSLYTTDVDPHTADLYFAANRLVRFDPRTNVVRQLNSSLPIRNVGDHGLVVDRAPATGGAIIHASTWAGGSGRIARFDRSGTNLGIVGAFTTQLTGVILDRGRNLSPLLQTAPNHRLIRVSFAGEAGKPYVLALSLAGCSPGTKLPDGRVIPLNPDHLTVLTATQSLPPLLLNNLNVLSANEERIATLNLNPLGNAVKGVRLWAAALTLDPLAPLGISQISGPLLLIL